MPYNPYLKPPRGIRAQNLGNGIGMPRSGNCKYCNEWESELIDGYCKDNKCKRVRQLIAFSEGKAVIYYDGLGENRIRIFKSK